MLSTMLLREETGVPNENLHVVFGRVETGSLNVSRRLNSKKFELPAGYSQERNTYQIRLRNMHYHLCHLYAPTALILNVDRRKIEHFRDLIKFNVCVFACMLFNTYLKLVNGNELDLK